MSALVWLSVAVVLGLLELLSFTFVLLFFSLGALLTAGLAALFPLSFPWQAAVFTAGSVISLVLLRSAFRRIFSGRERPEAEVPEFSPGVGVAVSDFKEGKGRVDFAGTTWPARCAQGDPAAGEELRVTAREGLELTVEKK